MLQDLVAADGVKANGVNPPSSSGAYLFVDAEGRPLYVGISSNLKRIREHWDPSSPENKASFAFNITKKALTAATLGMTIHAHLGVDRLRKAQKTSRTSSSRPVSTIYALLLS